MTDRSVEYVSNSLLECAGCAPADIVICVSPDIVSHPACPSGMTSSDDDLQTTDKRYVYGQLTGVSKFSNSCGGAFYRYVFVYDDAQLLPGKRITCNDIQGVFCLGCLAHWVQDLVGQDVSLTAQQDGQLVFTNQHGCQYIFRPACISADEGNLITTGSDNCLYATVASDNTINGDGTSGNPLHVAIYGPENLLNYAPDGTLRGTLWTLGTSIDGNGTFSNPLVINPSADAGNELTYGSDGRLFVGPDILSTSPDDVTAVRLTHPSGSFEDVSICPMVLQCTSSVYGYSALPIIGNGSIGNPTDLLFSADSQNAIISGSDGGVYTPGGPINGGTIMVPGNIAGGPNVFNPNVYAPSLIGYQGTDQWNFNFPSPVDIPAPPYALPGGFYWIACLSVRWEWQTAQGVGLIESIPFQVLSEMQVDGAATPWGGDFTLRIAQGTVFAPRGAAPATYADIMGGNTNFWNIRQAAPTPFNLLFIVSMGQDPGGVRPNVSFAAGPFDGAHVVYRYFIAKV